MIDPIRVLVVDDSTVMRKLITDILESTNEIEVVGTARNGYDAIDKVRKLRPDVITMDIEMPKMDGLTALQMILIENPTPVIMISAMDKRQADITIKALEFGAVDFISKTSGTLSLDIDRKKDLVINKIKIASKIKVKRLERPNVQKINYPVFKAHEDNWVVVIGTSTGGPKALPEVLSRLPGNLPAAVLVVQHMPEGFTKSFAERLNWYTSLEVHEAVDGEPLKNGVVYVAPGNAHLEIKGRKISLSKGPQVNNVRPSVDVMMSSAAKAFGPKCIGIILTGMGQDGKNGMNDIKNNGGFTIAQNEETCVVYGMPKAVIDFGIVNKISPLNNIAENVINIIEE